MPLRIFLRHLNVFLFPTLMLFQSGIFALNFQLDPPLWVSESSCSSDVLFAFFLCV